MTTEMKQGRVKANGLDFAYWEMGSGPLALCLHGFPDSPRSWRHLMPVLANAGFRAVAPYNRGYAPTAIPTDGKYSTGSLVADVNALHQALGGGSDAVLIAHDWGAVAAWGAAAAGPKCWRRLAILNIPPLAIFGQVAFTYEQIKRSFYFWFFQMEVAESIVGLNDLAFLEGLWADWSPNYKTRAYEVAGVKDCLRNPANLNAAMGYYRSLFNPKLFGLPDGMAEQGAAWGQPVTQPTLYLHGQEDGCVAIDDRLLKAVLGFCGPGSEVGWVRGAGHFMMVEKPDEVNERVVGFLTAQAVQTAAAE